MTSAVRSWLGSSCRSNIVRRSHWSPVRPGWTSAYSTARRDDRPFRMAVVGSGPAGFYTAYRVMSKIKEARIDMFEALPVPFGLVRFGVAPDHPEVKNCQNTFEELASSPNFTFVGNVSIGNPGGHFDGCSIPLKAVLRHYDAIVFAYGASKDKTLGIPGETSLKGIYSAREFVGWYNGLPEYGHLAPDLTRGEEAVVVGQGNVALDVARMLLEDVDTLRKSDITEAAIETLSRSRISRVHIVGRRGPMQAAYTIKEIRELMKLPGVGFHPVDLALVPDEISKLPRVPRRLTEVVVKGSTSKVNGASKTWSLDFCLSPAEFVGDSEGAVCSTVFERTSLSDTFEPHSLVNGTGEKVQIPSAVVFRSIGYKSTPIPGFEEAGIAFDERRGTILNDGAGRALRAMESHDRGALTPQQLPGVYCAGWVKRGPTGVIASTMEDAFSTGEAIIEDWTAGKGFLTDQGVSGWSGLKTEIDPAKSRVISWQDWRKIDQAERERGSVAGKEREKFTSTTDMLSAAA